MAQPSLQLWRESTPAARCCTKTFSPSTYLKVRLMACSRMRRFFHVPRQELPRVLQELWQTLKPGGILFSSNPRGNDQEGFNGTRFGSFHSLEAWRGYISGRVWKVISQPQASKRSPASP